MELGPLLAELVDEELEESDGCLWADGLEMDEHIVARERLDRVGIGGEDLRKGCQGCSISD